MKAQLTLSTQELNEGRLLISDLERKLSQEREDVLATKNKVQEAQEEIEKLKKRVSEQEVLSSLPDMLDTWRLRKQIFKFNLAKQL